MNPLIGFVQERWFVILIAIVVLLLVVKLIKTVMKWVIVLAIIAALLFYGASYKDKLASLGTGLVDGAEEQAIEAMANEAKDAKFSVKPDGSFTATGKNLTVEGKAGADEVTVTFKGTTMKIKMNKLIKAFIDQAKQNPPD
jgi:hypothetical protein